MSKNSVMQCLQHSVVASGALSTLTLPLMLPNSGSYRETGL